MNPPKKLFALFTIVTLLFSFFTLTANAEEDNVTETPEEVITVEADAGQESEAPCEVSTNASILIKLDAEYLITVGEFGEVLAVDPMDMVASARIYDLTGDQNAPYDFTLSSLIEAIQTSMNKTDQVSDGEIEVPELEITVTTDNEVLLTSLGGILSAFDAELELELEEPECEGDLPPLLIQERFTMASNLGITPGRMRLLEKYIASLDLEEGAGLTLEELLALKERSVKDLMAETNARKKATKAGLPYTPEAQIVEAEAVDEETVTPTGVTPEPKNIRKQEKKDKSEKEAKASGESSKDSKGNSKAKGKKK